MDYIQKKYLDIVRLKLYSFMIYHVVAFWTKEMMYKSVKLSNIKLHILFLICGAVCTTYMIQNDRSYNLHWRKCDENCHVCF